MQEEAAKVEERGIKFAEIVEIVLLALSISFLVTSIVAVWTEEGYVIIPKGRYVSMQYYGLGMVCLAVFYLVNHLRRKK